MALPGRVDPTSLPKTLLSWRLAAAAVLAVVLALVGIGPIPASLIGLLVYAGLVGAGVRRSGAGSASDRTTVDPFSIGEPWRQFVQSAQRSRGALDQTLRSVKAGPLRDRLTEISERLSEAVDESSAIAQRGNEIDGAVKRIDPTRLRSRLATLHQQQADAAAANTLPSPDDLVQGADPISTAIASVDTQLATADRLKALSAETANQLRLAQARLDELVARAAEVSIGTKDTDTYAANVDDLVDQLEALRLAVAETEQAA